MTEDEVIAELKRLMPELNVTPELIHKYVAAGLCPAPKMIPVMYVRCMHEPGTQETAIPVDGPAVDVVRCVCGRHIAVIRPVNGVREDMRIGELLRSPEAIRRWHWIVVKGSKGRYCIKEINLNKSGTFRRPRGLIGFVDYWFSLRAPDND